MLVLRFLAVLHRLETYLVKVADKQPSVQITLIALMGKSGNPPVPLSVGCDPRIDSYEECCAHSNYAFLQILNEMIPQHYPGRLAKVLVVNTGKGRSKAWLGGQSPSHFAQTRVTVLNSAEDLKKYVHEEELVTFAGGSAEVTSDAFKCSA